MKNFFYLFLFFTTTALSQADSTFVDAVHLREIPKHNLALDLGITQPLGDFSAFAGSGLSMGLTYEWYTNKNWGTSIALRHQSNQFVAREATIIIEEANTSYAHTSIALGPVYSHTKNRFQLDIAPRLGAVLLNRANSGQFARQDMGTNLFPLRLDRDASSSSAFYGEITVRFNYYFRRSVQVFVAPTYTTTLGKPYRYDSFPTNASINPSNLIFNLGIKIALGPTYSNGELRDDRF